MALLVSAFELFVGTVVYGVGTLVRAAVVALKGAAFLLLAPIAPLVLLGWAGYAVARGRSVQGLLDELNAQTKSMERRRALGQFQRLLSTAVKAFPSSVEIETDTIPEPFHNDEIVRPSPSRRRHRRRTA